MQMQLVTKLKKSQKQYPNLIRNVVLVVIFLIFLIGSYIFGKLTLSSAGFFPVSDIPSLFRTMQVQCVAFAVAILLLYLLSKVVKEFPWKYLLISAGISFGVVFVIILFTNPNQSADPYWNLILAKGLAKYHLNPYTITPNTLAGDPWLSSVSAWRDISMTHGPLWVWFISPAVFFTNSLGSAITYTRFMYIGLFIATIYIFWKVMGQYKFDEYRKTFLVLFLVLNPYVMQNIFVDLHNDILIMFFVLLSLYLYKKSNFVASSIVLFLTGLVKYLPAVLMLIPVIAIMQKKDISTGKKALTLVFIAVVCLLLTVLLFLPFVGHSLLLPGLVNEATNRWSAAYAFPIPLVLKQIGVSPLAIRTLGLLLMVGSAIYFSIKKKELLAYTVPILLFFFFGTPWFQPWYALWIFPLLLLTLPFRWIAIMSAALVLTPWVVYPLPMVMILILVSIGEYCIRVIRGTNWWIKA